MNKHPCAETRVLIAEDESLTSAALGDMLEKLGVVPVGEAFDGYQAVEMTQAMHPDAVLMDIDMPGLDGLEATRRIQAQCPTPIVILTAHPDAELIEKAREYGVGAYLLKPPNAEEIARTLSVAIARFDDMMALRDFNARLQEEICERANIERQLRCTIQERDMLLKEVYHRVKNNFMAVSALLELQANNAKEPQTKAALRESGARVKSMSIIHERLYRSQTLSEIDFSESARTLAVELFHTYKPRGDVSLNVSNAPVKLPADQAIPCVLLLNELVTNALKYAFPDGQSGKIDIELRESADDVFFTVSDNGVGLDDDVDPENSASLGLKLITAFVQQLRGHYTLERDHGVRFCVAFPKHTPG